MTDTQLYFAIGLPCFVLVASLITNLWLMSGMREDIRELRADMKLLTGKVYEMMAKMEH